MHLRDKNIQLLLLFIFAVIGFLVWLLPPAIEHFSQGHNLRVVFFDVGQGDSIFIESPNGVQVLIDGGPNASVLRELSKEMGFFDRSINVVIATHEDRDHIGGLSDVLDRYQIGAVVLTENEGESLAAETFRDRAEGEGAKIIFARRGMTLDLGDGAMLEILFPDRDPQFLESNTASIITRLVYGESEFLFTGDAPKSIEDYLVSLDGKELRSDVLKVGHHGSRTSTSKLFLGVVDPAYAIISAAEDNRYGHPHKEVIDLLEIQKAEIKSTAEEGSIVFESDSNLILLR